MGLSALFSQVSLAFEEGTTSGEMMHEDSSSPPSLTLHEIRRARRPFPPFHFLRRALLAPVLGAEEEEEEDDAKEISSSSSSSFFSYDERRGGGVPTPRFARRLLVSALKLLSGVITKDCARLPSFDAVFADLWISVEAMNRNLSSSPLVAAGSPKIRKLIETVHREMEEEMSIVGRERAALRMQHFAPTVKALTPKVQVKVGAFKVKDEKQRVQALKRSLKRERKGVARELRLDAQFVADTRRGETQAALAAKKKQRKENLRFLELQQSDFNKAAKSGVKITGGGGSGGSSAKRR